ncbi:MAG: DUF1614 domain-containing protein [Gammaproteobacteria bacterium]|nr:DUF1614 domain-containing protein [Gammaproteobacteria bacterium]
MQKPPNFIQLLIFSLILIILLILVQVGVISIVMEKLGLSQQSIILILFCSLFGSLVNLPLFTVHSKGKGTAPLPAPKILFSSLQTYTGKIIIAINVGGALIPIFISFYLLNTYDIQVSHILVGIGVVTLVSYFFSRPVQGIGIGIPIFVAPFTAAIIAILLETDHVAPLAYIVGTLGILLGADILRLPSVRQMSTSVAAIGGAGTFDGIFLTGVFAVLLT